MRGSKRILALASIALLLAAATTGGHRLLDRYRRQLAAQPTAVAQWERQIAQARQHGAAQQRDLDRLPEEKPVSAVTETAPPTFDSDQRTESERWLRQAKRLKQAFADRSDQWIPELALLHDKGWLRRARVTQLDTPDRTARAFAILRNDARNQFVQFMQRALDAYLKANGGQLPGDTAELRPYLFDPTLDPAMLAQYRMVRTGRLRDAPAGPVIQQKSVIDDDYDATVSVDRREDGSLTNSSRRENDPLEPASRDLNDEMEREVRTAVRAFAAAHRGTLPTAPAQLLPYFDPPLGPLMTESFTRPMTSEERKKFEAEVARLAGVRR